MSACQRLQLLRNLHETTNGVSGASRLVMGTMSGPFFVCVPIFVGDDKAKHPGLHPRCVQLVFVKQLKDIPFSTLCNFVGFVNGSLRKKGI